MITTVAVLGATFAGVASAVRAGATGLAPYLATVGGGPLADVVVDGAGHAYASNPARNEVEVLSLTTRTLEAPIAVGLQPYGLDLSADGTLLYVANFGAHYVSVVDLAQRREVRRIAIPSGTLDERPFWIAVANDGTALVTTAFPGSGNTTMSRIDLVHETVQPLATIMSGSRVRASADRSHIGVAWVGQGEGPVAIYTAATKTLSAPRALGGSAKFVAFDRTGSKLVVDPGTYVLGADLTLQATIASGGRGIAVNGPGTTAYRVQDTAVEVLDLTKHDVVGSIPLPEPLGASQGPVALTADDATLVILTGTGISVLPVSASVPSPACTSGGTAAAVNVCGAPLADVVMDGAGHAFATNPARDEVEVVSVATGALEAPIAVGSQPRGLDFSADGRTLYVANSGANDISVVDVAQRRELRRISIPTGSQANTPFAIAVAGNGTALVTTMFEGSGFGARMLQLDLAHETVRTRPDFWTTGATVNETRLEASADRSKIAIAPYSNQGEVFLYNAVSDSFTSSVQVGALGRFVALDRTGNAVLADPGGHVLDGNLVLRASIPAGGQGVAVNASGSTGYRVQDTSVDVLDLARGLVSASIPLAAPVGSALGAVALSPDGSALVVLTAGGLTIARTGAAVPIPACVPKSPVPSVVAVCGAALADAVIDGHGHLYASNLSRNEVEVVSLATKTLEASIPVGSQPTGLDLSVDGSTLYVANSGGSDISVVDVASRREVRRIVVPPQRDSSRPSAIAVGANGVALLALTSDGVSDMLSIDLATGTVNQPVLFTVGDGAKLEKSADRSHIAVVENSIYGRRVTIYNAATATFGHPADIGAAHLALNGTGSKLLAEPSGEVVGADLIPFGAMGGGGDDVAMNRAGTIGYRIRDGVGVEVLDLSRYKIERTIALPEGVGAASGRIVLSPDETALAVLTGSGVSIVPVSGAASATAFQVWTQPTAAPLDGTGGWLATANDPVAVPGQLPAQYLYGHYFSFTGSSATGVVGLVTDPAGKFAVVNVVEQDGTSHSAAISYKWTGDRIYFPFVTQIGPGSWGAWVYDYTAATWTPIGVLTLPVAWGKLSPGRLTAVVWYGPVAADCSDYPRADVFFYPPGGYSGGVSVSADLVSSGATPAAACPTTTTVESSGWARSRVGAELPAP